MQPTKTMAEVLLRNGIQVDSSVFKGGRIRDVGVDYRPAARQGWYWRLLTMSTRLNRGAPPGGADLHRDGSFLENARRKAPESSKTSARSHQR